MAEWARRSHSHGVPQKIRVDGHLRQSSLRNASGRSTIGRAATPAIAEGTDCPASLWDLPLADQVVS